MEASSSKRVAAIRGVRLGSQKIVASQCGSMRKKARVRAHARGDGTCLSVAFAPTRVGHKFPAAATDLDAASFYL
jgi:hypothetical protein